MTAFKPQNLPALLAAIVTAVFVAANAAHAFSVDPQSGTNSDGSAKYVDPDEQFENFTSGKSALGNGSGFFNFNLRPSSAPDQRGPSFTPGYPANRTLPDHRPRGAVM